MIREDLAGQCSMPSVFPPAMPWVLPVQSKAYSVKLEPGAMMLRTSDCHIRLGHFEWINQYQGDLLPEFTQKCIEWHYPDCLNAEQPILAFATQVIQRTAVMISHWQLVGFAHGVMNTDNLKYYRFNAGFSGHMVLWNASAELD